MGAPGRQERQQRGTAALDTPTLLENWIDEAEQRAWFRFESDRTGA